MQEKKETMLDRFQGLLTQDMFDGEYRTVKEYAEDLNVSERTVRNYLQMLPDYEAKGGKVVRK